MLPESCNALRTILPAGQPLPNLQTSLLSLASDPLKDRLLSLEIQSGMSDLHVEALGPGFSVL
jgi:hypothetical protein